VKCLRGWWSTAVNSSVVCIQMVFSIRNVIVLIIYVQGKQNRSQNRPLRDTFGEWQNRWSTIFKTHVLCSLWKNSWQTSLCSPIAYYKRALFYLNVFNLMLNRFFLQSFKRTHCVLSEKNCWQTSLCSPIAYYKRDLFYLNVVFNLMLNKFFFFFKLLYLSFSSII